MLALPWGPHLFALLLIDYQSRIYLVHLKGICETQNMGPVQKFEFLLFVFLSLSVFPPKKVNEVIAKYFFLAWNITGQLLSLFLSFMQMSLSVKHSLWYCFPTSTYISYKHCTNGRQDFGCMSMWAHQLQEGVLSVTPILNANRRKQQCWVCEFSLILNITTKLF